MKKKRTTNVTIKRGLSISAEDWQPFADFVDSLDITKGSQRIHVTNSDAAVAAFRLLESLGVDKARKVVLEKLRDEPWWSELAGLLKQFQLPEQ